MDICVICNSEVNEDNAPVLEMGGYGNPKYLCDECACDLDECTTATEYDVIASAISRLAKKISDTEPGGRTFVTVQSILEKAASRANEIKEGTYDFANDKDDSESEELYDIPEELLETEEDRELDRQDEERAEKANRIFDYVAFFITIGVVIFIGWKLIDTFILK